MTYDTAVGVAADILMWFSLTLTIVSGCVLFFTLGRIYEARKLRKDHND